MPPVWTENGWGGAIHGACLSDCALGVRSWNWGAQTGMGSLAAAVRLRGWVPFMDRGRANGHAGRGGGVAAERGRGKGRPGPSGGWRAAPR